ncbi:unnamed protein product [Ectocarpus sp. 12 AP-2014]
MVDVRSKRCGGSGCSTRPSFGVKGGPPAFCKEHREAGMVDVRPNPKKRGMVDVVSKRCRRTGCRTRSTFGVKGGTSEFCAQHRQEGMVNVRDKLCGQRGCFKIPSFATEGSRAAFCKTHKKNGMVNVKLQPSKAGKRKRVAREEDDCGSDSDSLSGGNDSEQHFSVSAERALRLVFSPSAVSHNPSSKLIQIYV